MHALVCVWVLHFKTGWRLLAVFRSNRGSVSYHAVKSRDKRLLFPALFIPHESHSLLGDRVVQVGRMSE